MPEDDDRSREAASAGGPGWSEDSAADTSWADAVAPDDLSSLAGDVAAYHRELRAARRRAAIDHYVGRPGAPVLTVILVALGLAAVVATLLTVAHPNHRSTLEGRAPLAHPTISAGMRGGLVPAVDLQTPDGQPQASQDLRPGVIALMPASCRCGDLVVSLADTTATATKGKLALFAIAPGVKNADGDALPGQLPAGSAVYDDPDSTLAAAIGGSGLTLVLVQPDGTIYQTLPDVTASSSDELTKQLVAMLLHPPAS